MQVLQLTIFHPCTLDFIKLEQKEFGIGSSPRSRKWMWLQQSLIVVVNVAGFILGKETCKDIWAGNVAKSLTKNAHIALMLQTARKAFRDIFFDVIRTCQTFHNHLKLWDDILPVLRRHWIMHNSDMLHHTAQK